MRIFNARGHKPNTDLAALVVFNQLQYLMHAKRRKPGLYVRTEDMCFVLNAQTASLIVTCRPQRH